MFWQMPMAIHNPKSFTQLMSQFDEADMPQNMAIGSSMSFLSLFCLAINLIVLRIILREKELFRLNSYKFMFALGLADCLQLCVHFATGFFTIWQTTLNPRLNKLLGAIITPSYVFYALLTFVLAINRLISLSSTKMDNLLYSSRGMRFWLAGSALIAFCFLSVLASPWAGIIYLPHQFSWTYDSSGELSGAVKFCEMLIEIGASILSAFLYASIFFLIIHKKNYFAPASSISVHPPPGPISIEFKILIQALVITAYCTALNFLWHNSDRLLPNSKMTNCALNFMWIGNGAINPLIYFAVNMTIRRRIVGTFGGVSAGLRIGIMPKRTTIKNGPAFGNSSAIGNRKMSNAK